MGGPARSVAERLGYPADSKLLIIHADDLAAAHSVDACQVWNKPMFSPEGI